MYITQVLQVHKLVDVLLIVNVHVHVCILNVHNTCIHTCTMYLQSSVCFDGSTNFPDNHLVRLQIHAHSRHSETMCTGVRMKAYMYEY